MCNHTLKWAVLATAIFTTCHWASAEENKVGNSGVQQAPASDVDAPIIRIRSEVIHRRDIMPDEEIIRKNKDRWTATQLANFIRSSQMEAAFHLVVEKTRIAFCEHADCTPDPKDVADWKRFLQLTQHGQSPELAKGYEQFFGDEPAHWQANKALYERYGGRVTKLNLSGFEPIEARLRLLEDMEKRGEIEFYDQQIRADVLEYFKRYIEGAVEVDESFRQREGMRHPWERPWWRLPTPEEMQKKVNALQSKR